VKDEDLKHLISWCLEFEPDRRPTIDQVMEHAFFSTPPM
jgi:serine/threonine protein kinase